MKNQHKQGFLDHVKVIRDVEADKDMFLKAARLERHESMARPLTAKEKIIMCAILSATVMFSTILILGYLSENFIPALVGVGVISIIGIFTSLAAC